MKDTIFNYFNRTSARGTSNIFVFSCKSHGYKRLGTTEHIYIAKKKEGKPRGETWVSPSTPSLNKRRVLKGT
jgi:hypothetical protein